MCVLSPHLCLELPPTTPHRVNRPVAFFLLPRVRVSECVCGVPNMTPFPREATRLWRIPQPPPALTEFQTGQDVFALLPNGQWAKAKVIGVEASAYIIEYVTVKGSGAETIPFGAAGTQLKPVPSV